MTTLLRRLASPTTFTSSFSTAGSSNFNGRRQIPRPGQVQGQANFGATRFLQLSSMFIDMQVKGCISHTRLVQEFLSTNESWTAEASYSFRIPIEAAVTSFKLEIGDDHAIEDESRPSKRARTLYNKAVRSEAPAAILREVEPGVLEATLGRIPPGVQITIMVKFVERILPNATEELIISYPALLPSAWSSSSDDTKVSLKIEIIQEGLIHTILSPTHQKLLSIKAGATNAAREAETFASLQQSVKDSTSERPNQATVSLSGTRRALHENFELVIKTSNEAQRTKASLSATNKFGHGVLVVNIRPCDLFDGGQDMQWSVDIELDHPWTRCSADLRELNLARIPHREGSLSPNKFQFIQSPKSIPKLSHRQNHSVFFLLDFGDSSEYFLDSVCITATSPRGIYTMKLSVKRTNTANSTLQKLCVSSILRDTYNTLMPDRPQNSYAGGRSLHLPSLIKSAERLGQMYSLCNHWTSKIAVDSMRDSDQDTDSDGPRLYGDDLSRLVLPIPIPAEDCTISYRPTDNEQGIGSCVNLDSTPMPRVRGQKRFYNDEISSNKVEDEQPEDDVDTANPTRKQVESIMNEHTSPLVRNIKGKTASSIRRYEWRPAPINNSRSRMATPVEERLQCQPNSPIVSPAGKSIDPPMYKCLFSPCPYKSKRESNCKQHMEKAHGWEYVRTKTNGKKSASKAGSVTHGTPQMQGLPTPISKPSAEMEIPLEETLPSRPSSLELPPYIPDAESFNFSTLPQENHLDTMDAIGDPDFRNASTTDYQWDDIYSASQYQAPASTFNKELAMQFVAFSDAQLCKTEVAPHISPLGQGNAMLYNPHSLEDIEESFDDYPVGMHGGDHFSLFPPTAEEQPTAFNEPTLSGDEMPSFVADDSHPKTSRAESIIRSRRFSYAEPGERPPTSGKDSSKSSENTQRVQSSPPPSGHQTLQPPSHANAEHPLIPPMDLEDLEDHFLSEMSPKWQMQPTYPPPSDDIRMQIHSSIQRPEMPPMTHFADAYRAPTYESYEILLPNQEEISQQECQSEDLWTQIEALRTASGTYPLDADLRPRIESQFSSGTRAWLVERVVASGGPRVDVGLMLEDVVDTMLVRAYVKTRLVDHYSEVEWHACFILNNWEDQETILEELVSRMVEGGDDGE